MTFDFVAPEIAQARVLIVGCGNIGGVFDIGRDAAEWPYSHAGAYARDGRYRIDSCVEPDQARRREFMAAWGIPAGFGSIDEVPVGAHEVISICSPTPCHAHDLEVALALRPKLIFCEKPVTTTLGETERLTAACQESGVLLAVNYSRRFDPDIGALQAALAAGAWGQLHAVVGTYNKGILNNGSHMLDLLNLLVGELTVSKVGKPVYDFFPHDPTVPVWLTGPQGLPVQLACGHAGDYAIFELQFIFAQGVLTMEEGGLFWRERRAKDSQVFKGYRVLDEGVRRAGSYPQAMQRAIENIHDAIYRGEPLKSTGVSALAAQRLCGLIARASGE